jgi:hypothetical protein
VQCLVVRARFFSVAAAAVVVSARGIAR